MEDNFPIQLNRIREDFHQEFEKIMANSVAERNSIRDNTIREISEIPKKAAYQAVGIGVGGVDFCFGIATGIILRYNGFYAVPLLLWADGASRWVGVATENKDLALYGIISPVVKGIKKLNSYLRR